MTTQILTGDNRLILPTLPDKSIHCCVTSPPYWGLRDYGISEQLGLENTPEEYVKNLVDVFREVWRVLRDDGTVWLNLGDSYYNYRPGKGQALVKQTIANNKQDLPDTCARRANVIDGLKEKDLVGIPWRVAFALQADGWYLRSDVIWHKPNVMPEAVKDRPTKSHEYIFLLTKQPHYYYDSDAIREPLADSSIERAKYGWDCDRPSVKNADGIHTEMMGERFVNSKGRNKRSVWTVPTNSYKGAHFATFPLDLITPCILAGCPSQTCKTCGAPYIRQIERSTEPHPNRWSKKADAKQFDAEDNKYDDGGSLGVAHTSRTVGFISSCNCNAEIIPGLVLDPFGGSGTTAVAANKVGRNAIIIDLNPEYVALAEDRVDKETSSNNKWFD